MAPDPRAPVLVGAGQWSNRVDRGEAPVEPVDMMAEALRRAAADSGAARDPLAAADAVRVVAVFSHRYRNAARLVAERTGARPRDEALSPLERDMGRRLKRLPTDEQNEIPDTLRRRGELEAQVSVNLIERRGASRWQALARPAKRLQEGDRLHFGHEGTACLAGALDATVVGKGENGEVELAFDLAGPDLDAGIAAVGQMPLPPYIAGRRPPEDLETMLELVWLYFTAPRKDPDAFEAFRQRLRTSFANRSASPEAVFQDTLSLTLAQHHPRAWLPTVENVQRIDLDQALEIYRDRYADAGDFTSFPMIVSANLRSLVSSACDRSLPV